MGESPGSMSGIWKQEPMSIQRNSTPRGLRVALTAVLAVILIVVGTGWFVDHVQTNQRAHNTLKTLLATRKEVVRVRRLQSDAADTHEFELSSLQAAYDKLSRDKIRLETLQVLSHQQQVQQELSHQQQIVKEHERSTKCQQQIVNLRFQKQEMKEYEEEGLARAEALLAEETNMRRKLDTMVDKEKAARIVAQTLHMEEKELRIQLEAQHEELQKQHASLKILHQEEKDAKENAQRLHAEEKAARTKLQAIHAEEKEARKNAEQKKIREQAERQHANEKAARELAEKKRDDEEQAHEKLKKLVAETGLKRRRRKPTQLGASTPVVAALVKAGAAAQAVAEETTVASTPVVAAPVEAAQQHKQWQE